MIDLQYIEITKSAFDTLTFNDVIISKVVNQELARREFYKCHDMVLQVIFNYISGTSQYYLADINS